MIVHTFYILPNIKFMSYRKNLIYAIEHNECSLNSSLTDKKIHETEIRKLSNWVDAARDKKNTTQAQPS